MIWFLEDLLTGSRLLGIILIIATVVLVVMAPFTRISQAR